MEGVYATQPDIASKKWPGRSKRTAIGSTQPADLFLGHHALDILGLALDAVAGAAVRLDRQAGDNGIDAALLDDGAALRPLQLVVDVVVDRVIMGHRRSFRWRGAFRRNTLRRQALWSVGGAESRENQAASFKNLRPICRFADR